MKLIKMLGAVLLSCAAVMSVGANGAQEPVGCVWSLVSSDGPPSGATRYIVLHCKESNGNQVATRNLVWTQAANGYTSCTISTGPSIGWTGDCMSPSFYRTIASSSSAQSSSAPTTCTTPGMRIQGGCANSYDSSMLTNPTYVSRCGSGCSVEYRELGWNNVCPYSGIGRSPEYGLFCK
jgi:hypothetical protein